MSPHAVSPGNENLLESSKSSPSQDADFSPLRSAAGGQVDDLVCVGFGPASLAIAVALHDALEAGQLPHPPKVRFLEKQVAFAWHAGMLLPGARMQITFIKDLATLRNPRSRFTFLNYLHDRARLVAFANLGTFLPQRIEYEDYMRWCARHFDPVVDYARDVHAVHVGHTDSATGLVEWFDVTSTDTRTGETTTNRARNVVVAVGGRPNIPPSLQLHHPAVIHSSQYVTTLDSSSSSSAASSSSAPRSVAIIGAGQSAAEIFHNIPSRFSSCRSHLLIRDAALRPSDDSPFVNEIFDPRRVHDIYAQHPDTRAAAIARDKQTNYGVVRLQLLDDIYAALYAQHLRFPHEQDWPHQILPHRCITRLEALPPDSSAGAIRLHIDDHSPAFRAPSPASSPVSPAPRQHHLDVDLVVLASGYTRTAHEALLAPLHHLMPRASATARWTVREDYSVEFRPHAVRPDAGVWLQGCNEATHGLSDTLLSILAVRAGELVERIFRARGGGGRETGKGEPWVGGEGHPATMDGGAVTHGEPR